jgi:hypothetical protein
MNKTTSPLTLPSLFTNAPEYPSTGNFEVIDIPKTIHTDATLFPCSHEVITKKIFSHRYHLGAALGTGQVTYSIIGNQKMHWF